MKHDNDNMRRTVRNIARSHEGDKKETGLQKFKKAMAIKFLSKILMHGQKLDQDEYKRMMTTKELTNDLKSRTSENQ